MGLCTIFSPAGLLLKMIFPESFKLLYALDKQRT